MADVQYLKERACACREAARTADDRRETRDLLQLAKIYDRQVQQWSDRPKQQG